MEPVPIVWGEILIVVYYVEFRFEDKGVAEAEEVRQTRRVKRIETLTLALDLVHCQLYLVVE